jgi:hypothetical protein
VIDAAAQELIERQIRRDGRSLLQYVGESFPYTPTSGEQALAQVNALAREEQEAIARLVRFLHRQHVSPPVLGSFPSVYTNINFVSLVHLLPGLLQEQQAAVAELERSLASLPEGEARRVLWEYLEMKRRHRQTLTEIGQVAHVH